MRSYLAAAAPALHAPRLAWCGARVRGIGPPRIRQALRPFLFTPLQRDGVELGIGGLLFVEVGG